MLKISLIDSREGINKLHGKWDELFKLCPGASVFQSWEWVASCAEFLGGGRRIFLLCAQEGDQIVGIAPLETTPVLGLPVRRLQFTGTGISDILDFLVLPGFEERFFQAVCAWLDKNPRLWDVIDLHDLPSDSRTPKAFTGKGWRSICRDQNMNYYRPLPPSWDEYLQEFGRKKRHEIRRIERVLSDEHEVLRTVLSKEELAAGMDTLFSLHTNRWQQMGDTGIFCEESRRRFYNRIAELFYDKGWIRLQCIKLDGKLKAVGLCFTCNGKAGYYITGWDASLAGISLGSNLLAFSIKDSIEQGLTEFDFLRGAEDYKSHWTKHVRMTKRLFIYRRDLRSLFGLYAAAAEKRIGYRTRRFIQRNLRRPESHA